jgi:acyl transferase domain-containing protein
MVIDTACSSTITALHQAISCISAGDSKVAIVCGANLIMNPDMFVTMSELGFLSPRGKCHSFDASGDGYARGEGVLSMIIKPLADAIADNDPIKAVIKGSRLNQDGKTGGITLPSGDAQQKNMQHLYQRLELDPDNVQYFEAHGTGTRVGDPIEMGAIEQVFASSSRKEKLIVGSVKSNCGHLESCAALIGIIKTVECMERGWIPGQLHLQVPNPKINFDALHVPLEATPWPITVDNKRTAVVNSFGFGGANGKLNMLSRLRPRAN